MIAVVRPSSMSTSGRAIVGMNPCTKALYVSLISRCDSAAIVLNTSELLPEPETPVNTVSRRFAISMLRSLRLLMRAPCTRIRSWRSASRSAGDCVSVLVAVLMVSLSARERGRHSSVVVQPGGRCGRVRDVSAQLLDAEHVAGGVAGGAVPDPVRLLGRLLDDLGVAGLQLLEGAVEVLGGQVDAGVGALGHHLGDGAALLVGDAGVGGRRMQDDGRAGLAGGADRDPAHPLVPDVVADLETEGVAVEGQGGVRVVVREVGRVDGDVHDGHAMYGSRPTLLDS